MRAISSNMIMQTYRNYSFNYLLRFVSVQESFSRKKHFLKNSFFFSSNFFKVTIDYLTTRILNFMVIEKLWHYPLWAQTWVNIEHFSVLAEFVLWEFSTVSSLPWYRILVQHACNDRAWLTSEWSPRYDNFGTVCSIS